VKPPVQIRACQQEDAKQLERQNRAEPQRWQRQQQGRSTFLVAVSIPGGVRVGMGEIQWDGCEAPEVRQRYPSCPELNGLEVWPAELRSHGIGTAIVHTAEDLAPPTRPSPARAGRQRPQPPRRGALSPPRLPRDRLPLPRPLPLHRRQRRAPRGRRPHTLPGETPIGPTEPVIPQLRPLPTHLLKCQNT
jgi:hypothetical protein